MKGLSHKANKNKTKRIRGKIFKGSKAAKKLGKFAILLLFPTRCPVCDKPVKPFGALICAKCRQKIRYVREPRCYKCGKELKDNTLEYCFDCLHKNHVYDRGFSLFVYSSVRNSIYRFKYAGRREYAEFFGKEMAEHLGEELLSLNPDALVPVPMYKEKEKKRGYNQAHLLAQALGKEIGVPVCAHFAERTRNTAPLKELGISERQNNLKKAFKIQGNDVKLSTIVIIDDIYTTGSTINEIARECRRAGVEKIYFAALASGSGR